MIVPADELIGQTLRPLVSSLVSLQMVSSYLGSTVEQFSNVSHAIAVIAIRGCYQQSVLQQTIEPSKTTIIPPIMPCSHLIHPGLDIAEPQHCSSLASREMSGEGIARPQHLEGVQAEPLGLVLHPDPAQLQSSSQGTEAGAQWENSFIQSRENQLESIFQ